MSSDQEPNPPQNTDGGIPDPIIPDQLNQQTPINPTLMEYEEHNFNVSGQEEEVSAQDEHNSDDDCFIKVKACGKRRCVAKSAVNVVTTEGGFLWNRLKRVVVTSLPLFLSYIMETIHQ